MRLSVVVDVLTKLITMTQMYEWITMRLIIIWQSGKDLTTALVQMMDTEESDKFLKIEARL